MNPDQYKSFAKRFRSAITQRLWDQWDAVGVRGYSNRANDVTWAVDPEALILASSRVFRTEPRMREIALWWTLTYGGFLSIARLKRMQDQCGFGDSEAMAEFAETILATSPSFRSWKAIADWGKSSVVREVSAFARWDIGREEPFLTPQKQVLRLRSFFGVTSRAEIVLWLYRSRSTISELATNAVWYHKTIQKTVAEMSKAAHVEKYLSTAPVNEFKMRKEILNPLFPEDFPCEMVVAQHFLYQGTFELLDTLEKCEREGIAGRAGEFLLLESLRNVFPQFQKSRASDIEPATRFCSMETAMETVITNAKDGSQWPRGAFEIAPSQWQGQGQTNS